MHFATVTASRAAAAPDAPAVSDDVRSLSNRQFDDAVGQAAAVLRSRGIGAGDVVAVMLPNAVDFVVTLFAAWRLGATVTPVNPALGPREIGFQIADCSAAIIVTGSSFLEKIPDDVSTVTEILEQQHSENGVVTEQLHRSADDVALLIYTSGTTGRPKGVILDHANLDAMSSMAIEAFSHNEASRSLLILPLFHVNGIVISVLAPLAAGGSVTILGRFDPRLFFERIEAVRPTYFSGVPTIFTMLANLPESVRPDTSSVQFAVCGAAPASAELLERFEQRFGIPVVEGYGLSEATCASTVNPLNGVRKPGTVGPALPGQTVIVVDEQGAAIADGRPGEILVKGPNVMRGYLGRPEETATTVVDGWLHTGDIGQLDIDGYLTLVDRAKDMIIRNGENIYPKEIENAAYQLDGVREVAVVGQPHPVRGEEPVMFASLNPGTTITADDIQTHLADNLAKYKRPVTITITDEVPKNPVGKIDKPALRRQLPATSPAS
ncbi:class I adenylate-forming enzyme family protein [Williamsia phyllosphaerae]|uniref:Long-chain-fatty-acid--CoA ligase n=1 Tax=Williamsia phyllosphaerae TaxID=885042 RepID=A0ABQ1U6D7_9NOCA|nr:AMP-binding protein [Williamsia phyllosphaerae]GGF11745.1 long-chain-fatty-acid--CoA ligase [Williamsia phyllosphaerae]